LIVAAGSSSRLEIDRAGLLPSAMPSAVDQAVAAAISFALFGELESFERLLVFAGETHVPRPDHRPQKPTHAAPELFGLVALS